MGTSSKYLDELFGTARNNDTCLCLTPNLYNYDFNKENPLMIIPDNLRLRITIINKGGNRLQAQFDANELMLIEKKFNLCVEKMLFSPQKKEEDNIAYTTRFYSGKLKGKSPAEVLNEPDGQETLNNQFKWLRDNLATYPNNQKLMDAITEASKLFKAGTLKKVESVNIPIYSNEYRYMTGLEKDTRNCYTLKIECALSDEKAPYIISMTNNIFKLVNGKPEDKAEKTMSQSFSLTEQEFSEMLEKGKRFVDSYTMLNVSKAFKYYTDEKAKSYNAEPPL